MDELLLQELWVVRVSGCAFVTGTVDGKGKWMCFCYRDRGWQG